jgi:hypothetical protein
MTPAQCELRQKQDDLCQTCEQNTDKKELSKYRCTSCLVTRVSGPLRKCKPCFAKVKPAQKPKEEKNDMAKKGKCDDCKRTDVWVMGRGLCSVCLKKHKDAGTLDEKHPAKRGGRVRGSKAKKAVPTTAAPATPSDSATGPTGCGQEDLKVIEAELGETPTKALDTPQGGHSAIALSFGRVERDAELLQKLMHDAAENRRTPEGQILAILDEHFGLRANEQQTGGAE